LGHLHIDQRNGQDQGGEFSLSSMEGMSSGEFSLSSMEGMSSGEFSLSSMEGMSSGEFSLSSMEDMSSGEFGLSSASDMSSGSESGTITVSEPNDTTILVNTTADSIVFGNVFSSNGDYTKSYGFSHTNTDLTSLTISTNSEGKRCLFITVTTDAVGVDTISLYDTLYTSTSSSSSIEASAKASFVLTIVTELSSSSESESSDSEGSSSSEDDPTLVKNSVLSVSPVQLQGASLIATQDVSIRLNDVLGRSILSRQMYAGESIHLHVSPGIYILHANGQGSVIQIRK
ncbi:MAG TPA: hypothetical protein VLM37_03665, partial [Fibrobacteraceae bacterium]|nr:hypothetical protein [Fibrobacteraceae bacterium]